MKYQSIPVTSFAQNCSVVWCETTKECAFIDPGGDIEKLTAVVEKEDLKPVAIWLTHGHLDHVGGTVALSDHYQLPIIGPQEEDAFWLDALPRQSQMFGFSRHEAFRPTKWLNHGDILTLGKEIFEVRFTPGHTPGHVVILNEKAKIVFVGDVLFAGSVGRTDFPRGDHKTLMDSIKSQLWSMNDEVVVVSGHGPNTNIGHEKRTNAHVS